MIDRSSGVPAYRQVAADLREKIKSGNLSPGTQLPSERELVESYGVSRVTVRDAVGLLRSEGVVTVEHGRGVFVRPPTTVQRLSRSRLSRAARDANQGMFLGDAAQGGFTPSVTVRIRFEPADEATAQSLEIEDGTEVTVRDRVMRADGLPVQLAISRLPRDVTRQAPAVEQVETGQGGAYARLEEAGFRLGHFNETVTARMPTPDEASLLQLASGVPVIVVTRIAYTVDGKPVEVNDMILSADRYELSYDIPAE
ncbi:transcriptional regulator [Longimycelium tulufanense]|uniref:Transcriptional regulator n=1 Tax=Longimycelium tulufanense TaxID=907463 RepID=A0A8J3FYV0_9PSEU|nr:GntR family transcriptional regulator [Longimycelium tulufanense]GGM74996.1 transcriptional regulator [Longimycelium tulufanense]